MGLLTPDDQLPEPQEVAEDRRDEITFGQQIGAAFNNADLRDATGIDREQFAQEVMEPVIDQYFGDGFFRENTPFATSGEIGEESMYRNMADQVQRAQRIEPERFGGLPSTPEGLRQLVNAEMSRQLQENQATITDGSGVVGSVAAEFIGGTGAFLTSPEGVATLAASIAVPQTTLLRTLAADISISAAGSASQYPRIQESATRTNEEAPGFLETVATDAAGEVAVTGFLRAVGLGYRALNRNVMEPPTGSPINDAEQRAIEAETDGALRTGDINNVPDTTEEAVSQPPVPAVDRSQYEVAQLSLDTRAVNPAGNGITNISLDFNASPNGGARGTEVIIPDNASPELRAAAETFNNLMVEFARARGIEHPNRGVRTRSENGRGVSGTIHVEPFFNDNIELQNAINEDFDAFVEIYEVAFGGLQGVRILPPHGVRADRGAASAVFNNETEFGRRIVQRMIERRGDQVPITARSPSTAGSPVPSRNPGVSNLASEGGEEIASAVEVIADDLIRQASASRQSTQSILETTDNPAPVRMPNGSRPSTRRPTGLIDFVISQGGLNRADQAGDLAQLEIRRPGFLRRAETIETSVGTRAIEARGGGLLVDTMRGFAAEEGFLPADSTVADFLDLLDQEARGNRVYRQRDQFAAAEWAAYDQARADMIRANDQASDASADYIRGDVSEDRLTLTVNPEAYRFDGLFEDEQIRDQIASEFDAFMQTNMPPGAQLSQSERDEIIDALSERGGDVMNLVERAIERQLDNAVENPLAEPIDDIPFFDNDAAAQRSLGPIPEDPFGSEVDAGAATSGFTDDIVPRRSVQEQFERSTFVGFDATEPDRVAQTATQEIATIRQAMGMEPERLIDRTAAGDQTLIDGVAPITDADRIREGQAAPLDGGPVEDQSQIGGLFDANDPRRQDLFDAPIDMGDGTTLRAEEALAEVEADLQFLEDLDLCERDA